uniref:Protein root UVB sensitive 3 n=1 Tax=Tanacetum cinerariifolium TaxID=118510 RepID=A0A6L2MXG2_TANCI|nr:protein root UVB sensitive 3 [Tanacetum cinerariifolium]
MLMDLLSLLFPSAFVFIVCIGSLSRTFSKSFMLYNMYANYQDVRCLNLTTLNCERGSIVLRHFMVTGQGVIAKYFSSVWSLARFHLVKGGKAEKLHLRALLERVFMACDMYFR